MCAPSPRDSKSLCAHCIYFACLTRVRHNLGSSLLHAVARVAPSIPRVSMLRSGSTAQLLVCCGLIHVGKIIVISPISPRRQYNLTFSRLLLMHNVCQNIPKMCAKTFPKRGTEIDHSENSDRAFEGFFQYKEMESNLTGECWTQDRDYDVFCTLISRFGDGFGARWRKGLLQTLLSGSMQ